MIRSRLGLKALVLGGLVFALTAFVAGAAQAEKGAKWNVVNGAGTLVAVATAGLSPQLEIKEIENNTATLLFTLKNGTKVALLCTAAKFDEGGKLISEGGISLGKVLFTGCKVSLNEKLAPACQMHTAGKANGEILTLKVSGLLVLDETRKEVKLKPDEGTKIIVIEMGEECAIGTSVPVEGELWLKDCSKRTEAGVCINELGTELVDHLAEEGVLHKLTALSQPATIDGSVLFRLINSTNGNHLGLKWNGEA